MEPHEFWQGFAAEAPPPPWAEAYPAAMPGGRILLLPIRPLAGTGTAIASLIVNQAAFAVEDALADALADALRPDAPEVVVGLPTLGLGLARAVAARLGHTRYVALGTSAKFWYDPALSVPLSSITSPGAEKRLYLDPRLAPLLEGRRVALVDDVVSTGRSMGAALDLMDLAGVRPAALGAAMLQTGRARAALAARGFAAGPRHVIRSPLLAAVPGGWAPAAEDGREAG